MIGFRLPTGNRPTPHVPKVHPRAHARPTAPAPRPDHTRAHRHRLLLRAAHRRRRPGRPRRPRVRGPGHAAAARRGRGATGHTDTGGRVPRRREGQGRAVLAEGRLVRPGERTGRHSQGPAGPAPSSSAAPSSSPGNKPEPGKNPEPGKKPEADKPVAVGDVIASAPAPGAPNGLLAKVTEVVGKTDLGTEVKTASATLASVLNEDKADGKVPVDPASVTVEPLMKGVTFSWAKSHGTTFGPEGAKLPLGTLRLDVNAAVDTARTPPPR